MRLFESRARIPDNTEFPRIHPEIESYDFPAEILTDKRLEAGLDESRLRRIRDEVRAADGGENELLRYIAPWDETVEIGPGSVDLVLSQAVMEYLPDLETAYGLMYGWLKSGGAISHEIDFKSHGTAISWDGHWGYSSRMWKLVNGRAACPITRYPHSCHIGKIAEAGFRVVCDDIAPKSRSSRESGSTRGWPASSTPSTRPSRRPSSRPSSPGRSSPSTSGPADPWCRGGARSSPPVLARPETRPVPSRG